MPHLPLWTLGVWHGDAGVTFSAIHVAISLAIRVEMAASLSALILWYMSNQSGVMSHEDGGNGRDCRLQKSGRPNGMSRLDEVCGREKKEGPSRRYQEGDEVVMIVEIDFFVRHRAEG